MKKFISYTALQILAIVIITPLILKACDREAEYQEAKYAQWEYERKNNLPYTTFSE